MGTGGDERLRELAGTREACNVVQKVSSHIIVFCNTFMCLISCLLLFKDILLCMQEHNPSLIRIIVAANSRKLERTEESRNLLATRGSDEVPMVLFRSGSFILNKPPTTLITIANIKAIKVKV